ncbi:hypothetical protein HK100_005804 [Physocladia obscura]|uniref:Alginate lyase 2 domain-containing protein n=1 Tax=Physocladia obscura TaxID=109957 RepID=A0AAD5STD3_9FUNG|nr:hypothetical protein HK100_005804 [Physocladia obscura]
MEEQALTALILRQREAAAAVTILSLSLPNKKRSLQRKKKILYWIAAVSAAFVILAVVLLAVLVPRRFSQNQSQLQSQSINTTVVTTTTFAIITTGRTNAAATSTTTNTNTNTSTNTTEPSPGKILNLSAWELQLPIAGNMSRVAIITPPALNSVSNQFFQPAPAGLSAVDFYTPVTGVTTSDSLNPRTELRQLNQDGSLAFWSYQGSYALQVILTVELFPANVSNGAGGVIVCQLFSAAVINGPEYVVRAYPNFVQLERGSNANGSVDKQVLVPNYTAGQQMKITFSVMNGKLTAAVDIGTTVTTTIDSADDYYFKAGSYCQTQESADNGCKVRIFSIQLYGFPGALAFPPN